MSNDLIYKVNFIMNSVSNGDSDYIPAIEKVSKNFKNTKIWNMDIDIFHMMKTLYHNINGFNYRREIEIRNTGNKNKKNNFLYSVFANAINITPSKTQKEVALSTARQYCQTLSGLEIVMFSDFKKWGCVLECNYIQKKLENFKNMGFSIILNGQKSAIDWVRNLGFSLFM